MGLAKDDCGELMDRTVASSVIVPRPGLEVKGAAVSGDTKTDPPGDTKTDPLLDTC